MRNVSPSETPSLFSPDLFVQPEVQTPPAEEKTAGRLAREFVRWCWNVGGDFRNSPDHVNLLYWLKKNRIEPHPAEEDEILAEARSLFLKKAEQAARKAESSQRQAQESG
jgi:hypothetical protein